MTLAAEMGDWFNQTITLASRTSHDGKKPTYGSATNHSARVELGTFPTRDSGGREVTARGRVFINMTTIPLGEDKLTLPSGLEPLVPPIWRILPHYDEGGAVDHVEIEFG